MTTTKPKVGPWSVMYALKRRMIDKQLLAEVERRIAAEEARQGPGMPAEEPPISFGPPGRVEAEGAREAISRAFGRPFNPRPRN